MSAILHDTDSSLERLARKRAGAKMGWYIHATVYAAVNLMLVAIAASSGHNWAIFPLLGWGVGLAIHGLVVFLVTGGAGLHERLVQQERRRLATQRDAW
jgi:2TM domain